MSDRYIEKSFLVLLLLSLLLHVGAGTLLYYLPESKPQPPREPVFVDLQQVPDLTKQEQPHQQETPRQAERRVRVPRESAPRGLDAANSDSQRPPRPDMRKPQVSQKPRQREESREAPVVPGSSVSSLLKPRTATSPSRSQAQLYPGAGGMAKLEESYRRKYENEIAEGETRFLNSDDILFGSFLRRLENSIYGVWRYPQEAAMKGIEGVTPVRITFNRRGEITGVKVLESSGAKILDDEVLRTLKMIGPIGGFPKGYDKEEFHLIAFFQYGGSRRSLR